VDGEANVTPTGQAITSAIGTVITRSSNSVTVTGLRVGALLNPASVSGKANFTPAGVEIEGELGNFLVWSLIDESQTPNWEEIAA
jgi:hypothetical protein